MREVERNFRVSSDQKIQLLTKMQDTHGLLEPKHQVDEVYLLGIGSFKDFIQGMPVIRLRTENGRTQLTYKRRMNDAGDMTEHELTIGSATVMRQILAEMDYRLVTLVDKVWRKVSTGEVTLALDCVKGLGDFLEIEIVVPDGSHLAMAEPRIIKTAADYALAEADLEYQKYDKLLAQAATAQEKLTDQQLVLLNFF